MTRTLFTSLLLAVALLLGCSSSGSSVTAARLSNVDMSNFISLSEAIDIAQQEVPDGFAVEAELEVEDDDDDDDDGDGDDDNEATSYEVKFFVAGANQIIEVAVDATTGEVLEVEVSEDHEDDESEGENESGATDAP